MSESITDQPLDESLHYLPRRTVAKAVGATLGAAYVWVAADTARQSLQFMRDLEDQIWPHNEPSLTFLDEQTYTGQRELAVFLPGFNDVNGTAEAQQWREGANLRPNLLTCSIDYSNGRSSMDDIADLVKEKVDTSKLETISLFGRSMGGLYAIALAAKLGIPVRSIVLCSTPSKLENAYLSGISNIAAILPVNPEVSTGLKYIGNLSRQHTLHPDYGVRELYHAALERTIAGGDPVALHNTVKWYQDFDIEDARFVHNLGKVCRTKTKTAYAATRYPNSDTVVMVKESGADFEILFREHLQTDFTLFGINYAGHADVRATVLDMQPWFAKSPAQ